MDNNVNEIELERIIDLITKTDSGKVSLEKAILISDFSNKLDAELLKFMTYPVDLIKFLNDKFPALVTALFEDSPKRILIKEGK